MPVIVTMESGDKQRLDRGLSESKVVLASNEARGSGKLIEFSDDRTPSRHIYVDPDRVESVRHDGHTY